jgi:ABC-type transport system involved in cytochrome bd biosynthesis fused ATPase/permease subunit
MDGIQMFFDLTFTPYQIVTSSIGLVILYLVYKLILSKKYKIATVLILFLLIVAFKQPLRLTTNTTHVNIDRVSKIENDRTKDIPERVTIERLSYQETLQRKSEEIRNRD